MRYKCYDCEAVFHEDDAGSYSESRGEFWGSPCYESMMCCPECGSTDFDEYNEEDEEEEEDDES